MERIKVFKRVDGVEMISLKYDGTNMDSILEFLSVWRGEDSFTPHKQLEKGNCVCLMDDSKTMITSSAEPHKMYYGEYTGEYMTVEELARESKALEMFNVYPGDDLERTKLFVGEIPKLALNLGKDLIHINPIGDSNAESMVMHKGDTLYVGKGKNVVGVFNHTSRKFMWIMVDEQSSEDAEALGYLDTLELLKEKELTGN